MEEAAVEAVSEAILEPLIAEAQKPASQEEVIAKAVSEAIRKTVPQAVGQELAASEKRSRRAELKSGMFYFVAGVLATVAITLFVHPAS